MSWSPLDWIAYGCIGIAATMPALGLAMSAEESLRDKTAKVIGSRWWKLVPFAALIASAVIFGGRQLGLIGGPSASEQRIAALEAKRDHLQGESDYRRIAIWGRDGLGGLMQKVGALETANAGLEYENQTLLAEVAQRSAPDGCANQPATGARGLTVDAFGNAATGLNANGSSCAKIEGNTVEGLPANGQGITAVGANRPTITNNAAVFGPQPSHKPKGRAHR
jgi:hypothetical protein